MTLVMLMLYNTPFCRKMWTQEIWWWSTGPFENGFKNKYLNPAFCYFSMKPQIYHSCSNDKKTSHNRIFSIPILNITSAEYLTLWAIWNGKYTLSLFREKGRISLQATHEYFRLWCRWSWQNLLKYHSYISLNLNFHFIDTAIQVLC